MCESLWTRCIARCWCEAHLIRPWLHMLTSIILNAAGDCILVRGEGEKQPFVSFHKALLSAFTERLTASGDVLCGR